MTHRPETPVEPRLNVGGTGVGSPPGNPGGEPPTQPEGLGFHRTGVPAVAATGVLTLAPSQPGLGLGVNGRGCRQPHPPAGGHPRARLPLAGPFGCRWLPMPGPTGKRASWGNVGPAGNRPLQVGSWTPPNPASLCQPEPETPMPTPIERLIDQACGAWKCSRCGTTKAPCRKCWVELQCGGCGARTIVERFPEAEGLDVVECECPDCR
jgi:hypothetical protein